MGDSIGHKGAINVSSPTEAGAAGSIRNVDPPSLARVYKSSGLVRHEIAIYQPTLWWFTSTAFPLFAGTFGPIANLFSVCALVQTWRIGAENGERVRDPVWLTAMNACSLFFAIIANVILLFNFAKRIPYSRAQPLTISLWYLSCVLLIVPIGLVYSPDLNLEPDGFTILSQAYYYGMISGILYAFISTLLLWNVLGAYAFHAYPPSFNALTVPQRTLMLQTISFSFYLALGAGIFAEIEDWGFADGVYWADYTLLTIGLGSDFPLTKTLSRMLLIPYAAFGITLLGLVVTSVRGLVLERAKVKMVKRHMGKERMKWMRNIQKRKAMRDRRDAIADDEYGEGRGLWSCLKRLRDRRKEGKLAKIPKKFIRRIEPSVVPEDAVGNWDRAEFELMRQIRIDTQAQAKYTGLVVSSFVVLIIWIGGSLIFWACEHETQEWTYPESLFFTYTTLLTIGYGDFYPNSNSGKPFFVVWSLISVPAMTIFISNLGDTVVLWIGNATVWASRRTILPERTDADGQQDRMWVDYWKEKLERNRKIRVQDNGKAGAKEKELQQIEHHETGEDANMSPQDVEVGEGADLQQIQLDEGSNQNKSLQSLLAKEIAILARDVGADPPKEYTWSEWVKWLTLLGVGDEDTQVWRDQGNIRLPAKGTFRRDPSTHPALKLIDTKQADDTGEYLHWHWTWLADWGPLLSQESEAEWVLNRLCSRLEQLVG